MLESARRVTEFPPPSRQESQVFMQQALASLDETQACPYWQLFAHALSILMPELKLVQQVRPVFAWRRGHLAGLMSTAVHAQFCITSKMCRLDVGQSFLPACLRQTSERLFWHTYLSKVLHTIRSACLDRSTPTALLTCQVATHMFAFI